MSHPQLGKIDISRFWGVSSTASLSHLLTTSNSSSTSNVNPPLCQKACQLGQFSNNIHPLAPIMALITRQTWTRRLLLPFGNLLGVTLLLLMLAPINLSAWIFSLNGHPPAWLLVILLGLILLGPLSGIAIDYRWRRRQFDAGKLGRWFSPAEGATLMIFPIWLVGTVLLLAMLFTMFREILFITHRLHG
jgi:hypothetical protein